MDDESYSEFFVDRLEELESIKAARAAEVAAASDAILLPMASRYGVMERQTWDTQAQEAAAYLADAQAPTPMLDAMTTASGVTKTVLAQRIMVKRLSWSTVSGAVIGQAGKLVDRIYAAMSVDEVLAVPINITLPKDSRP
ncbi:MAG: hypothetical protein ACP59X_21025 [Solidesulfovibrio sp. DCME]|uniref:hypothetical protein n=1 Tax=Solidesulfovibrio sp. DCME TaxID=3447380 RepID=UPI003D0CCE5D